MRNVVRKRFGQHFLEPAWVRKVVDVIDPAPGEPVLEIGPGRGALTRALLDAGCHVLAVEIDRDLAASLRQDVDVAQPFRAAGRPRSGHLELVVADVLQISLEDVVGGWLARTGHRAGGKLRVAGNLPYNISTPLLFKLVAWSQATRSISDAVLMLQREVAERLAAPPDTRAYGVLSIFVQLHADVEVALTLPPGAFRPSPQVTSAVVRFRFREPRVAIRDVPLFEEVVRACFSQRRKMLGNALRPLAEARGWSAAAVLEAAGVAAARRPDTLTIDEYATLAEAVADSKP